MADVVSHEIGMLVCWVLYPLYILVFRISYDRFFICHEEWSENILVSFVWYNFPFSVETRHQPSLHTVVQVMTGDKKASINFLQEVVSFITPELF